MTVGETENVGDIVKLVDSVSEPEVVKDGLELGVVECVAVEHTEYDVVAEKEGDAVTHAEGELDAEFDCDGV